MATKSSRLPRRTAIQWDVGTGAGMVALAAGKYLNVLLGSDTNRRAIPEDDVVNDNRVLMERDASTGIARVTLNNPERRNSYDAADARAARRVPRRARGGRRGEGRAAARIRRRLQHGRRHGQRVLLVRQGRGGPERGPPSAAPEPAAPPDRRPQDVRLLPRLPRLPEGDRRRGARLRARRRLRDGAHVRHLGGRARHRRRDARDALPRAGTGLAAHVLLPPRPDPGAPAAPHRRHDPGGHARAPAGSSPRSRTTTRSRRAPAGGRGRSRACPPTAS